MNNGRNAKDEISKLHLMIEDYHNQSKREESMIFNEQFNNSISYFSYENANADAKRSSMGSTKASDNVRSHFKLVN